MLNPKKTITTKRLTPDQLKEVFTPPPPKKSIIDEGLMSVVGHQILGDRYTTKNKIKTKDKLTKEQKEKLLKEETAFYRRQAFEDFWAVLSHVPSADSLPNNSPGADSGGGSTGVIGNFIIGENFEIGK